jgi:hypothetical protein
VPDGVTRNAVDLSGNRVGLGKTRLDSYSTRKDLRHALNGNSVRIIERVIRGIRVKLFGRGPLLHLHDEPAGRIIITAEH